MRLLVTSLLCNALATSAQTISVAQTTALSRNTRVVFYNVDVFDGYRMLRSRTVTIENGMIQSVTVTEPKPSEDTSTAIDGHGMTLLPGLIDAHAHIGGSEQPLEQAAALGVTTVLDMWGDPRQLAPVEKEIARGERPNAADFRTAGTGATVPKGHPTEMEGPPIPTLKPEDDVQSFVDARFAEGSDYLKIMYEHTYPTLSVEQLRALVLAAHKRNKLVVAHEGKQFEGLAEMQAGVDGVEHQIEAAPNQIVSSLRAKSLRQRRGVAVVDGVRGAGLRRAARLLRRRRPGHDRGHPAARRGRGGPEGRLVVRVVLSRTRRAADRP